jgi:serine/threonine protein kinase
MTCPNCQSEVRGGAQFCSNCGSRVPNARASLQESLPTVSAGAPAGGNDDGEKTVVSADGPADALAGQVLDEKYELVERIGAGGMGSVYRARRVHIGDEVAVKILHPSYLADESAVERCPAGGARRRATASRQRRHHPRLRRDAHGSAALRLHRDGAGGGLSLREVLASRGKARAVTRQWL